MKNLHSARGAIKIRFSEMALVNRVSSPRRLIKGGAAILAALKRNHQRVSAGNKFISPFVRNSLRVEELSYSMLEVANMAEEQSPCEIIISRVPWRPQKEVVISPAVKRPICPTEE